MATEGVSSTIEEFTGSHPRACPWYSFSRELVAVAVRAHTADNMRALDGDTPHVVVEAVEEYGRALNRVQGKLDRMARERRERERGRSRGR